MTAYTPTTHPPLAWKPDWPTVKQHYIDWWNQHGLVLWATAPAERPHDNLPDPGPPPSLDAKWYGPTWRIQQQEHRLAHTCFGGDSFPMLSTWSGAGDLAAYLGCPVQLAESTIWYEPIISDPDAFAGPLTIDHANPVLRKTLALIDLAVQRSAGRYLVSQPDLIENIDILASLRGTQELLIDMIERPEWVLGRLDEINAAFCEAFDLIHRRIPDEDEGNTFVFNLWGPGRTAKVQCDACSMFGPDMFRRFVAPALDAQCRWLDYAMFHLDGEECLVNLDALLEVESIRAVEWTPKFCYAHEGGGHPMWYDLYRRILAAGKSVQAIQVDADEVIPLLDAVGGRGMFLIVRDLPDEAALHRLEEQVAAYR
jgi:hypothetical protein